MQHNIQTSESNSFCNAVTRCKVHTMYISAKVHDMGGDQGRMERVERGRTKEGGGWTHNTHPYYLLQQPKTCKSKKHWESRVSALQSSYISISNNMYWHASTPFTYLKTSAFHFRDEWPRKYNETQRSGITCSPMHPVRVRCYFKL